MVNATPHTMSTEKLHNYCIGKLHSDIVPNTNISKVIIVPSYDRSKAISRTEKRDKLFNYKRPTMEIIDNVAYLYVFPGCDYVKHYAEIYERSGYSVSYNIPSEALTNDAIASIFPKTFPTVDIVVLGYVEPIVDRSDWYNLHEDISWKVSSIGNKSVAFVGVKFSYWGNIIYHLAQKLTRYTGMIIYLGKLGSLNPYDIPNKTIASGNSSLIAGQEITWNNIFADNPLIQYGKHYTLPTVLQETIKWLNDYKSEYRYVDPEIGWVAKACLDSFIGFSYLHLATDNLNGKFDEDLTNERDIEVQTKRLQYVGIMKSILWSALYSNKTSLMSAVLNAQQLRVDRGLLAPLERNWKECLSFAYHTQEEAWEIVRELPRRQWKDQEVIPENVLAEIADTQIQLLTTLAYAGFNENDLHNAIMTKLNAKRKDWK